MSIPDIFKEHGEEEFRRVERKVIARLIEESPRMILATGGGAFMNAETRSIFEKNAVTVWLKADLDVLWRRVSKKGGRPLLKKKNPKKVLANLLAEREPVYALADYTVMSKEDSHKNTVDAVKTALGL
jgi:shikimate kinase